MVKICEETATMSDFKECLFRIWESPLPNDELYSMYTILFQKYFLKFPGLLPHLPRSSHGEANTHI